MLAQINDLTFPSNRSNITLVETFIEEVFEDLKIKDEFYGNILVAVTEAVTNAIIHGNNSNDSKMVIVSVDTPKKNSLVFTIEDEGFGFTPEDVPDPTSPENIEKPHGRGIFLMKHLSDNVRFNNNGSSVSVEFNI
ncbi:MAG TPA: ATP-binding protein [Bacteroidetes bacterium]|nr:ATP-binding protein [Bacteroidota bacterium]